MSFLFPDKKYNRSGQYRILLVFLVLTLTINYPLVFSRDPQESGYYPVYNFPSKMYNAQEQNWSITEDQRGVIYFANTSGVVEYDGISFRLIEISDGKVARSLATDEKGRVYVGSENEFGYLSPDSIGKMRYVSLMQFVEDKYRDFQVVWNVYSRDNKVYFQSDNYLFIWDGESLYTIHSDNLIHGFFCTDMGFFARINGVGLTKLEGDSFSLIPGGEYFSKKPVYGVIQTDSSTLMVATERFGIFKYSLITYNKEGNGLTPFKTQADEYLRQFGIFNAVLVGTDRISVGTWGGGLVMLNLKGEVQFIADKNYGLQDPIIQRQYPDKKGNIWLALSKGISRIEVQTPISVFNNQNGLQGTIQAITRFNNRVFIATNLGVSFLDYQPKGMKGDKALEAVFRPVENLSLECWDLLTFKFGNIEKLLIVTNDNISEITRNNEVKTVMNGVIYDIYQSRLDPARVYVGMESGLTSLYFQEGKWKTEKHIEGIESLVSNISEDFLGNLWMGTLDQGVLKMNIKSFSDKRIDKVEVFRYDTLNGLPKGPTLVNQFSDRILIGTSKGLFKFRALQGKFEPDSSFGVEFADGSHYIHRICEIKDRQIWMATVVENSKNKYRIGYLDKISANQYVWKSKPFTRIAESIQHAFYIDDDGIVWIGGPNGLFRYDPSVTKNYDAGYTTLMRRVELRNATSIFEGTGYNDKGYVSDQQPAALIPVLPYALNSVSFEFAAQSGENEAWLNFSYMLEGYDRKWSEWTTQSTKEYTNLYEGSYVMRVRARNIYGNESKEAVFAFSVLSPWYRTTLAYIGYILFLAGFIFGIVKVYTRNLRAIIRERTAEVVRQKDEIQAKNIEITDSIHYASRIQSAILPPGDFIRSILPEYFILYLPRDIVSGDFYWINSDRNRLITVAADCTGHGVPGAFMSMLGMAFLNEIVRKTELISAEDILNQLRAAIIKSLRQTGKEGENKDGMDIALCIYDMENMKLQYAGANNPLYMIRNGELEVFKADKMPIGIHSRVNEPFTLQEINIVPGDLFYTFSDGYIDQFGGPEGKKFLSKQFREYLLEIHKENMARQKELLHDKIKDWMKNTFQVDDILVMGVKV